MTISNYRYSGSEYDPVAEFAAPYQSTARNILSGRYAQVIDQMSKDKLWDRDPGIDQLREKYFYLRQYYLSGAQDPAREGFLREIGRELMFLLRHKLMIQEVGPQPYHSRTMAERRLVEQGMREESDFIAMLSSVGHHIGEPATYYSQLELLFDYTWVGDLTRIGAAAIVELLHDDRQTIAGIHLLAGLYLGLLQCFNENKLKVICTVIEEQMSDALLGTALPVLLIIGRRYQQELTMQHPELVERMQQQLADNVKLNDATYKAVVEIYHAYSTTRDHQIFMDNVMPKLQELRSRLDFSSNSDIAEQMQELSERLSTEETIELQELMENAVKRMEDFDATGHDVEYHSMKEMKGTPFFGTVSHWFLPYDPNHPQIDPEVAEVLDEYRSVIFKGRKSIISSDLYSVATFPQWGQVMGQLSRLKEVFPPEGSALRERSLTDYMRDFLFGSYRFHHLSGARVDFYNPFSDKPYVLDGAFTQVPLLFSEDAILELATFFAKERHYMAAGNTYERVVAEQGIETGEAWRGIAVTRMIRKDSEGALTALQNAIQAEGMTAVTVSKAVGLLHELGRTEEEIELISRAEKEIEGECLVDLVERKSRIFRERGDIGSAVESAFKAVYLSDRRNDRALTTLGETLLIAGRASDAYAQLTEGEAETQLSDRAQWLSGVALIAQGKRAQGIERLRKLSDNSIPIKERAEMLALLGHYDIQPWEQALILDTALLVDNA